MGLVGRGDGVMSSDVVKQWIDSLPDWVMGRHNAADPNDVKAFIDYYDQMFSDYEDEVDQMMIECGQLQIFKGRSDAE